MYLDYIDMCVQACVHSVRIAIYFHSSIHALTLGSWILTTYSPYTICTSVLDWVYLAKNCLSPKVVRCWLMGSVSLICKPKNGRKRNAQMHVPQMCLINIRTGASKFCTSRPYARQVVPGFKEIKTAALGFRI